MNGDVYGLSEVQNFANGNTSGGTYTNAAANDLTTNLAAATGRNYQFIDTIAPANVVGGDITQNGTDAIRNVIIYDAGRVTPVGTAALYYQNDTNRPSLAQTFKPATGAKANSQTFTVVVNHFRSKGSACGGASDDPLQGNCNGLRLLMAQNVQNWLAGNPTAIRRARTAGTCWSATSTPTSARIPFSRSSAATGYTDLINLLLGAECLLVQFRFAGRAISITGWSTPRSYRLIKGTAELHINADEPAALEALDSNLKSAAAQAAYSRPTSSRRPITIRSSSR